MVNTMGLILCVNRGILISHDLDVVRVAFLVVLWLFVFIFMIPILKF